MKSFNKSLITKNDLLDRFLPMFHEIEKHKAKAGGLAAAGFIETSTANPIAPAPWFALDERNEFLRQSENEYLTTEYGGSTGHAFVREGLIPYFNELGCHNAGAAEENLTIDNILMTPGINSALARLYRYLGEEKEKKVAVITSKFFWSLPDPRGVEFFPVPIDLVKNEKITPEIIGAAVEKLKDYDSVIFYNANPDNPSGHIMSPQEADAFTKFFQEKQYSNLIVINDFAYNGTQFDQTKISKAIAGTGINSVTIFGISKLGAPGERIAAMAASEELIEGMSDKLFTQEICTSSASQLAMHFFFHEKNRDKRDLFLSTKADQYKFNANLLKTLVDGISTNEISDAEYVRMASTVAATLKIEKDAACDLLASGIEGISVINNPQAAFFSVIDFAELKGKSHNNKTITTGMDVVEAAFEKYKIFMLPLDLMTLGNMDAIFDDKNTCFAMRFTHSISAEEIVKTCFRLKDIVKEITLTSEKDLLNTTPSPEIPSASLQPVKEKIDNGNLLQQQQPLVILGLKGRGSHEF